MAQQPRFSLQQQRKQQQRQINRGGVRFNTSVQMYLVLDRRDMSNEEVASVWYGPRDFDRIQAGVRRTVRAVRRANRDGARVNDSISDRGLEHLRSSAHMEQRKINRDCCLSSVYDEQSRQRASGVRDEDALALASVQGSRWSVRKARGEALRDEEYVRGLTRSERTMSIRQRAEEEAGGTADILKQAVDLLDTSPVRPNVSAASSASVGGGSPPLLLPVRQPSSSSCSSSAKANQARPPFKTPLARGGGKSRSTVLYATKQRGAEARR